MATRVAWSKEIAATENIREDRLQRWKSLWCPYDQLPEMMKEEDRKWADKVIQVVVDHFIYL